MSATQYIAGIVKNLFERPLVRSRRKEEVYCLVKSCTGIFRGSPTAHDIKRHGVGNILVPFAPNLNRVLDVHQRHHSTESLFRPLDPLR